MIMGFLSLRLLYICRYRASVEKNGISCLNASFSYVLKLDSFTWKTVDDVLRRSCEINHVAS